MARIKHGKILDKVRSGKLFNLATKLVIGGKNCLLFVESKSCDFLVTEVNL
jgi:hypothetical protein